MCAMTTSPAPDSPVFLPWLTPVRVALVSVMLVGLLLLMPISTFGPGDHEQQRCGNALALDLGPWQGFPNEDYWAKAHRACTSQRIDRVAESVGVVALATLLIVGLVVRERRRIANTIGV